MRIQYTPKCEPPAARRQLSALEKLLQVARAVGIQPAVAAGEVHGDETESPVPPGHGRIPDLDGGELALDRRDVAARDRPGQRALGALPEDRVDRLAHHGLQGLQRRGAGYPRFLVGGDRSLDEGDKVVAREYAAGVVDRLQARVDVEQSRADLL